MARRPKKNWITIIGIAVFVIVGAVSYFSENLPLSDHDSVDAACYVDFIDCGQGDSTLICSEGEVTLIDATTGEDQEKVIDHLRQREIKKIDHFVLTHPHEDHIGGAVAVLDVFPVGKIYMKAPTPGTEPTTAVYINLLKKIKKLGKKVNAVEAGENFNCGEVQFEVLGPLKNYNDHNDQSVVIKAKIGKTSFLFTGDQESGPEKDLVDHYGERLKCTLLKAGHHGSSTSSCTAFLDAVSPRYAVISCGEGNSYGHPHKETLERFQKHNITYYRTDTQGTITFITDGKTLTYQEAVA